MTGRRTESLFVLARCSKGSSLVKENLVRNTANDTKYLEDEGNVM